MIRKAVLSFPNYQQRLATLVGTATLAVFLSVVVHARAQEAGPSVEAHKNLTVPRCAKIAASDPRFGPLAQACEYALSQNNLPSFVCDESNEQFTSNAGPKDWQNLAVVTALVTFEHGKGDRFSNVAKDGHPIRALSKAYNDSEVMAYFENNLRSRAPALNLFGSNLFWVFDPHAKAEFEYRGEMNADNRTMIIFGFRVNKSSDGPSMGWLFPGDEGQYIGMKGLLWIDKATSSLRRTVVHYTDFDPEFSTSAASSSTDYGWIQIGDLGKFLLPTNAEYIQCNLRGNCWRDVLGFSNCHKFAGKSRILHTQ